MEIMKEEIQRILSEEFKVQPSLSELMDYVEEKYLVGNPSDDDLVIGLRMTEACFKYKNFLKQPLEIGYFIPSKNNDPLFYDPNISFGLETKEDLEASDLHDKEYQEADESVIYSGFELDYESESTIQAHTIKETNFHGQILKTSDAIIFYKNAENKKIISDMEDQPINKNFWNFLK